MNLHYFESAGCFGMDRGLKQGFFDRMCPESVAGFVRRLNKQKVAQVCQLFAMAFMSIVMMFLVAASPVRAQEELQLEADYLPGATAASALLKAPIQTPPTGTLLEYCASGQDSDGSCLDPSGRKKSTPVDPVGPVDAAVSIDLGPAQLSGGMLETEYKETLTARGGTQPYTFQVAPGALPPGITLSSDGKLDGIPTAAGTAAFTATATDAKGNEGTRGFSIAIAAPGEGPAVQTPPTGVLLQYCPDGQDSDGKCKDPAATVVLAPAELPEGILGATYPTQTLTASGGEAPYSFEIDQGSLPPGISLSQSGEFTGTPTTVGSYTITAKAMDATGSSDTEVYSITIAPVTITLMPTDLPDGTQGTDYSQTLTASGGSTPYTYQAAPGTLPPGLTLSKEGNLNGQLASAGSYKFVIAALDANGIIGVQDYEIVIAPVSDLPPTVDYIVPGKFIVKLSSGASFDDLTRRFAAENATVTANLPLFRMQILETAGDRSVASMQELVSNISGVEYIEPVYKYELSLTPNDPEYSKQWGYEKISAPKAWDRRTDASDVIVAVIDSGVDYTHPDLAGNMWTNPGEIPGNGVDDDDNGIVDDIHGANFRSGAKGDPMDAGSHGTHVAGTIGAAANNGQGVAGAAWKVKIMALRIGDDRYVYTDAAIQALEYAIKKKVRISNNSWGGRSKSVAVEEAIQKASDSNMLFVAAAGNNSYNNDVTPHYPTNYDVPNVLSVMSSDEDDKRSRWPSGGQSHYGPTTVDLAAPGKNILSTVPGNKFDSYDGTSMASPHVAGAAALVLAENPDLTAEQLKKRLMDTVDVIPALKGLSVTGGRLNLCRALTNDVIDLVPPELPGGRLGQQYKEMVTADGCADFYEFNVSWGSAPDELTLSQSGELNGTPTKIGTFDFTVAATDANGNVGERSYSISISCPQGADEKPDGTCTEPVTITLMPPELPRAEYGSEYKPVDMAANGGVGPYTYAIGWGLFPRGLKLSETGRLSGVPIIVDTYEFSIRASDSKGNIGERDYSITVVCPQGLQEQPDGTCAELSSDIGIVPCLDPKYLLQGKCVCPQGSKEQPDGTCAELSSDIGIVPCPAPKYLLQGKCVCPQGLKEQPDGTCAEPVTITLSPAEIPGAIQGEVYGPQTLRASGSREPYTYEVASGALPPGLSLSRRTGELGGEAAVTGTYQFSIVAKDERDNTGSRDYSITVVCPQGYEKQADGTCAVPVTITLSPAELPGAIQGDEYGPQTLRASGSREPYTYDVASGALPPGLSLSRRTGELGGDAAVTGTYQFSIVAKDERDNTGSRDYSITVVCPQGYEKQADGTCAEPVTITLSPAELPGGLQGSEYGPQKLEANGGTGPYSYGMEWTDSIVNRGPLVQAPIVTGGTVTDLPQGLSLSKDGILTGVPASVGDYVFPIRVSDSKGNGAEKYYSISIGCPPGLVPEIVGYDSSMGACVEPVTITLSPAELPRAIQGDEYGPQTLRASGGIGSYNYEVASGSLPPGLSLSRTGRLGGDAAVVGTYRFSIAASDTRGSIGAQDYSVTVVCREGTIQSGSECKPDIDLVINIQTELDRQRCNPGAIDGKWGNNSIQATQRFFQHSGLTAPNDITPKQLLNTLLSTRGPVCPLECESDYVESDGKCVPGIDLIKQIQMALNEQRCNAGAIDGKWGNNSTQATQRFFQYSGLPASNDITPKQLLNTLLSTRGPVCPLVCDPGYVERNGRCVQPPPPQTLACQNGWQQVDSEYGLPGGTRLERRTLGQRSILCAQVPDNSPPPPQNLTCRDGWQQVDSEYGLPGGTRLERRTLGQRSILCAQVPDNSPPPAQNLTCQNGWQQVDSEYGLPPGTRLERRSLGERSILCAQISVNPPEDECPAYCAQQPPDDTGSLDYCISECRAGRRY